MRLRYNEEMINYNIKGTGVEIVDELRSYAEKHLQQAEKFIKDDGAHATVELEHQPARDGVKFRAEYTVSVSGKSYRAEEWGESLHAAMDLCIDELVSELRRSKEKRQHIFRRGAARAKAMLQGWRR